MTGVPRRRTEPGRRLVGSGSFLRVQDIEEAGYTRAARYVIDLARDDLGHAQGFVADEAWVAVHDLGERIEALGRDLQLVSIRAAGHISGEGQ